MTKIWKEDVKFVMFWRIHNHRVNFILGRILSISEIALGHIDSNSDSLIVKHSVRIVGKIILSTLVIRV